MGKPKVSARKWADEDRSGYESKVLKSPSIPTFKLKEGSMRIDIISFIAGPGNPFAEEGQETWERTFWTHRDVGLDEDAYVCPRKSADRPCPICEHQSKLRRQAGTDKDLIKALEPRKRQLFNVVDLDDPDAGVQVWDASVHVFGNQLKEDLENADPDDPWEYFADPDQGSTLKIRVKDTPMGNGGSFMKVSSIAFKPRKRVPDTVLNAAYNLDKILYVPTYEELEKLFFQTAGAAAPSADDDGFQEPGARTRGGRPAAAEDDGFKEPARTRASAGRGADEDDGFQEPARPRGRAATEDDTPPPRSRASAGREAPEGGADMRSDIARENRRYGGEAGKTAEELGIELGGHVLHGEHGKCEVIHINAEGTRLKLEDVDGEIHKDIPPADCKVRGKKPAAQEAPAPDDPTETTSRSERRQRDAAQEAGPATTPAAADTGGDWDEDWGD